MIVHDPREVFVEKKVEKLQNPNFGEFFCEFCIIDIGLNHYINSTTSRGRVVSRQQQLTVSYRHLSK